jgi:HK97 family phage major capsid protein
MLNFFESENGLGVAIDPLGTERQAITDMAQMRATNSVITNPAYMKPTTLAEKFQTTLKSVGNWMDAITIINDPAGNDLVLPYYDDAGNDGAKEAEGTDAIASSTDLDSAKITLTNYWISSTGVKVGWSTLRDVNYPIEQFVVDPLMKRLSRKLSYYATIGTGSSEPKGIAIAAVTGELAAKATYPTFTDLMNLIGMVDGAYDQGEKSGFMFHRSTALGIGKQVKSTTYNTDPLWQFNFASGLPNTLLGYKYWFNNSMNLVTTAPGNSVLFGDFSHFIMRMCGPLIITRLEERYAELGQVGFLISQYMDSNVDMVGTTYAPIKKIKNIMT